MALTTTTVHLPSNVDAGSAPNPNLDAASVALAVVATTIVAAKASKKYLKSIKRKLIWDSVKLKFKSLFGSKPDQIAGIDSVLFILLVVGLAAIAFSIFDLLGIIVILGIAAIIYLLLENR